MYYCAATLYPTLEVGDAFDHDAASDHGIPFFLHLIVGHGSIQDRITRYVITPVRECIYN